MPVRVSPVERVRAEIDQLFADPARDLAEVVEEVARLGAWLLLQTALEAEVTAFLGRERYQRDPDANPGHRNGHQPITVKTTSGPLTLARPKLRGTDQRFASQLLGHSCGSSSIRVVAVSFDHDRPGTLRATLWSEPNAHRAGGEQAANTLQPDTTTRHATTANAKVEGAIEASPLVPEMTMLAFTRQRPQVRNLSRPPAQTPSRDLAGTPAASRLPANHRK